MLTMAHPALAVEQFMWHFLNQWHVGFKPALTLNAKPNGDIAIRYNITAVNLWSEVGPPVHDGRAFRSSGRGARRRRRNRRSAQTTEEFSCNVNTSTSSSDNVDDANQTCNSSADGPTSSISVMTQTPSLSSTIESASTNTSAYVLHCH